MKKIFEFVKIANTWYYWWPDFIGAVEELSMIDGADKLLDSLNSKYVKLQLVDPKVAEIVLSKIDEDADGATYTCKSKNYNDTVWICTVASLVFHDEYPQNIYLKQLV